MPDRCFGSVSTVMAGAASYDCAKLAIDSRGNKEGVVYYDELDFELILGSVSGEVRGKFADKVLKNLNDEDKALLRTYFESEMSLHKTSEQLFIHKNSLQYKLNRIAGLTGYNPRKFTDAVVLYSAVRLEDIPES